MTPEGRIKELVKRGLKTLVYCHGNWPVQNGMGTPMLDWVGCIGGRYVTIETKKPGGKPTPLQITTMIEAHRAGAIVYLVSTPEEVEGMMVQLRWLSKCYEDSGVPSTVIATLPSKGCRGTYYCPTNGRSHGYFGR